MEIPIVITTIDKYYFETIMDRGYESEEELHEFAYIVKKGIESQLDWEAINNNAKQYLEK